MPARRPAKHALFNLQGRGPKHVQNGGFWGAAWGRSGRSRQRRRSTRGSCVPPAAPTPLRGAWSSNSIAFPTHVKWDIRKGNLSLWRSTDRANQRDPGSLGWRSRASDVKQSTSRPLVGRCACTGLSAPPPAASAAMQDGGASGRQQIGRVILHLDLDCFYCGFTVARATGACRAEWGRGQH